MTPYSDKPGLPPVVGGSLPTWVVRERKLGGVPVQLRITCPRGDCGCSALVDTSWAQGGYATRPCTYCFKTAKIPPRLRAGHNRKPRRKP